MDDPKPTDDRDGQELVISDPAIVADIRTLSARTGETPARAVHTAVAQRLKQLPATRPKDRNDVLQKLLAISKQGREDKLPGVTSDHSFLYDDDGLPI